MASRDPREAHRVSTPLELLFDLCFVVAVAQASGRLHHGLAEGQVGQSVVAYGLVFFAIWWAWMNFTWFASAYDTDDVPYRLQVLVQIAGALVLAAGVPRAFDRREYSVVTLGYVIMRVGLVVHWLRAAYADDRCRRTALRYAGGITACQIGWIGLLALPPERWLWGWLVLAPVELLLPMWAERAGPTPWHPRHIAERFGLFTLIVLGESVGAATSAIQSAVDGGELSTRLAVLIVGGLLIVFAMWWIYFDEPADRFLVSNRQAFPWAYGHLLIFASTAAVGAGLGVSADQIAGHAHLSDRAAGATVAVPVAIYVVSVWALHVRPMRRGPAPTVAFLATAGLVLVASTSRWSVLATGVLLALLAVVSASTRGPGA